MHVMSMLPLLFAIPVFALWIYLIVLIIRALRKYIKGAAAREENRAVLGSLAEKLRENRVRCNMTQEFVAEAVGVSRQAVSKWENGIPDPSTANLIALAKLYGVSADQLLEGL